MKAVGVPRAKATARSDEELIRALADGDLGALGELFEAYQPAVRRYVGRLNVPVGEIDDLVQATFLEVHRAAERFDPKYSARNWLFGIATMMVRRQRRSVARIAARIAAWATNPSGLPDRVTAPDEQFEHDESVRRLERALERLSTKKREVFVLVTCEGVSGEEAARILGVPVKTVWTRLHYARRELMATLEVSR